MNLLLIEPAHKQARVAHTISNLEKRSRKDYFNVPPLSLGVLAGLTPADWNIRIVQEPADTVDYDEKVDLVGITAATHNVKRGYDIADEFAKRGKTVVMGGIHPSVMYTEALQHCDSVCIGEAEPVWRDILGDFRNGKLKKTYRQKAPFDMSLYTPPIRELLPSKKSLFFNVGTVETSRGCPYNCDFCSVSITHGRKIRHRPLSNLLPEIESIERRKIFFVDNNIISQPVQAKALFREMIPLKKQWLGQASISIAKDPELVKLASKSGCFGLLVGIESVVKEGFKKYSKSLNGIDELKEAIKILKDNGIGIDAHLVFGDDFETKQTMRESLENLLDLDFVTSSLNILVPYPGTKLSENLEMQNRILTKDWNYYDINHLVFQPKNFSCDEFVEEMQNLRNRYFSYRSILSRTRSYLFKRPLIVLSINVSTRVHNQVGSMIETATRK